MEAEKHGFDSLFLSDHFHPWNLKQGHSSHIWSVLGALAQSTQNLHLYTGVTCPLFRMHPSTLAQAASTIFHLSGSRFSLGLGTGEWLNEHIVLEDWPPHHERLSRLKECIEILRTILGGGEVCHCGGFYSVDRTQLFDAAPELEILIAASGPNTARLAAQMADGLICLGPRESLRKEFGHSKNTWAQVSVCYAKSRAEGAKTAHHYFPEVALEGELFTQLATPREFQEATASVSVEDVGASIVCGPELSDYLSLIEDCQKAGFEGIAFHQIGSEQSEFLRFFEERIRV